MMLIRVMMVGGALLGLVTTQGRAQLLAAQADAGVNAVSEDERLAIIDLVEPRPAVPLVNTALAFTNTRPDPLKVRLVAFSHSGQALGSLVLEVPARGLKYAFVSRIIQNSDLPFVGWVVARASRPLFASAFLLGTGITDLPVKQRAVTHADVTPERRYTVVFPVTAAY